KAQAGGARRLVNDRISISLTDDLYSVEAHLAAMDQAGVDTAILTYSGVSTLGMGTCRQLNDSFADLQQAHKPRLYGSAHVPLTDPENAPAELERAIRDLGLAAIALPTSDRGAALDMPALGPLWHKITELDKPIILHPALLPDGASTDWSMERSCSRPFDTTLAAVRIMNGVFPEFPNLRFVLPHTGGTSIFLRGRISMFFEPPGAPNPTPGLAKTKRGQRELGRDKVFEERCPSSTSTRPGTAAGRRSSSGRPTPSRQRGCCSDRITRWSAIPARPWAS
ncbi:MAG TPA: amidohydrolase family protein, partial [Chloroflexota bacterium]|nr:amidohydrolase family protein [Chloroflexota bacterium]